MNLPTPYVVARNLDVQPFRDFLFSHARTSAVMPGAELGSNPHLQRPLHFTLETAQAHAKALNDAGASPAWGAHIAANPCPGCGRVMWANDHDFCYPNNRERSSWRAGCNVHDFGCGFELVAPVATEAEVLALWNSALVFEYPNESYARVERLGVFGLEAALKDVYLAYPEYQDIKKYPDGLPSMIDAFAADPFFNLHFVAKQYLYLIGPKEA